MKHRGSIEMTGEKEVFVVRLDGYSRMVRLPETVEHWRTYPSDVGMEGRRKGV
jgi:hypothetical protein